MTIQEYADACTAYDAALLQAEFEAYESESAYLALPASPEDK